MYMNVLILVLPGYSLGNKILKKIHAAEGKPISATNVFLWPPPGKQVSWMSGPYKAEVFDTAGGREPEQAASILKTNPLQQAGGFIFQPQQKVR